MRQGYVGKIRFSAAVSIIAANREIYTTEKRKCNYGNAMDDRASNGKERVIGMGDYQIERVAVGMLSTNCYLVKDRKTGDACVIDPGDNLTLIQDALHRIHARCRLILLTHGHFDHMMAADRLRKETGSKIYSFHEEVQVAEDAYVNLSSQFGTGYMLKVDEVFTDKQVAKLAGFSIQVLHTPGHTKGSVCYYLEKEGLLFSGDTLFAGSVGRSDFPTGSGAALIRSIKERLAALPDGTQVFPGHGDMSTIGYEKVHNPFIS